MSTQAHRPSLDPAAPPFARDDAGVAAVEFALVLPVMLLAYLGLVEVSGGVRASQQLDLVAHTTGDLVGQILNIGSTPAQLVDCANCDGTTQPYGVQEVFQAAKALMWPYPTTSLQITISEVLVDQNAAGAPQLAVDWSVGSNFGTAAALRPAASCSKASASATTLTGVSPALATASPAPAAAMGTIPSSYITGTIALGPFIVADVVYTYTPKISLIAGLFGGPGGMTMKRTSYSAVRNSYSNVAYPYLYNHIQYLLSSTPNAQNCLNIP